MIHTISTVVHTSGSVHCRRRYRDPDLAGFFFGSPSKYGDSPSFLRVTGRVAYRQIGIYETSMTTVRTWELGHWLRRNSQITFLTWRRPCASKVCSWRVFIQRILLYGDWLTHVFPSFSYILCNVLFCTYLPIKRIPPPLL